MNRERQNAASGAGRDQESRDIEAARDGDLEAFDRLLGRYEDQVYSVAFRLVGDEDDARDVTQEVFLSAYRHIKKFRGDAKFSTWLHRITVNTVKNLWARQKRQGRDRTYSLDATDDPDLTAPVDRLADSSPNPRRQAEGTEIWRIVEEQLQEIDPEYREVLVLRFVEGLAYEEIAEATGDPLGTVKSRIFRARRALKERLDPYLEELKSYNDV